MFVKVENCNWKKQYKIDTISKDMVALYIPDRTTATLQPLITAFTAPGSVGTTDQWAGYNFLARNGWRHLVVCHKKYILYLYK